MGYCMGFRPNDIEYLASLRDKKELSDIEESLLEARACTAREMCGDNHCDGHGITKDKGIPKQCISYVPDFDKLKRFIKDNSGEEVE